MINDADSMIDIAPKAGVLQPYFESNLGWRNALGELVDNAFDAEAVSVKIKVTKRVLTVEDDGHGCDDLAAMVTLGGRQQHRSTKLGRYGIGAKESVLWIGGPGSTLLIESVHARKRRTVGVEWALINRSGIWKIRKPEVEGAGAADRGTTVAIERFSRALPHGAAWTSLLKELGYMYSPALNRGSQISVIREGEVWPLIPYKLPEFAETIDRHIDVGGRKAHVRVGIVKPGTANERPGLTYFHSFRVILPACGFGCGSLDYGQVSGVVSLTDGWVLTKNKDEISQHKEELFAAVYAAIEPLLRKAESISHRMESADFLSSVESIVNGLIAKPDAKAKRAPGDEEGSKPPTGKGGRHKRAKVEQPGERFPRSSVGGSINLSYVNWPDTPDQIGKFVLPSTIQLNREHSFIRQMIDEHNRAAIAMTAVSLLVAAETIRADVGSNGSLFLPRMRDLGADSLDKFNLVLGTLMAKPIVVDGRDLSASKAAE